MNTLKQTLILLSHYIVFASATMGNTPDTVSLPKDTLADKRNTAMLADAGFYSATNSEMVSYTPKAPNSAGLVQYVDCPVSYYTGTPEINIPLYEIDAQGLKIPIIAKLEWLLRHHL